MRRPKIIVPVRTVNERVADRTLQVTMEADVSQLSDDVLAFYRRRWWEFWKPRVRREDVELKLGSALTGEHEPIERSGYVYPPIQRKCGFPFAVGDEFAVCARRSAHSGPCSTREDRE